MATKKIPTSTLAVIELSGKQYLVKEGDKITAEKLDAKDGEKVKVDAVLLVSTAADVRSVPLMWKGPQLNCLSINRPWRKIEIRKFRAKSRYRRPLAIAKSRVI